MQAVLFALLVQSASPAAAADPTIVVTARPLDQTDRAVRECLAAKCPPDEDIKRTLAHANNQFIAGDYADAQRTLRASIRRNDQFAKTYPLNVADLYRASGRVAINMGEGEDYRRASYAIGRSIRAGLPKDSTESLMADLEIAEMNVALRDYDGARVIYDNVAKRARRTGQPLVVATVALRRASLQYVLGQHAEARRGLTRIANVTDPAQRSFRLVARVLLAQIDRRSGDMRSSDALVREMAATPGKTPVLLYGEPIAPVGVDRNRVWVIGTVLNQLPTGSFDKVWADVGFWIRPDGTVADIDVLRDSGRGGSSWTAPVTKSIASRRYAPFHDPVTGAEGVYRIERYSYTALYQNVTGTRIRQRSPEERYERVDLSPDLPTTAG